MSDIETDLLPNLHLYSNKPLRNSYNFWQKKKGKHFPNGRLLHKLGKFQLPDDIDTTSLVHMVSKTSRAQALATKKALSNHANGYRLKIKNGHEQLKKHKAYSTWFGKDMPIEFDVCVLSNYFLWLNNFGFEQNNHDEASIQLLKETIEQSLYFVSDFKTAPEYPNKSIILYHLARLASQTKLLNDVKPKLIQDIQKQFKNATHPFEQVFLQSSLLKLGINIERNQQTIKPYVDNYWWFTAGLLSVYSNPLIKKIAPLALFHFRFVCPALNYALILENKITRESSISELQ